MAANHSIAPSILNNLYFDAFYALDSSFLLRHIYVTELESHNVKPSTLPLNLGEGGHFKKLKKPRGTSKDIKDFLTVAYTGAYALFLGTSIMVENSSPGIEKNHLLDVRIELVSILTRLYWQLVAWGFPIPKTNEKVDKEHLRKRLRHLIKVFLKDKQVRALVPPFAGRETLLLKWGLNIEYMSCLSEFMSKVKPTSRRYTI